MGIIGRGSLLLNMKIYSFSKRKDVMSDLTKDFGALLREKRMEKGYSQEGFAAYVGIERGNYGKMERGLVNIKLETLYRLANALDCDFSEIMPARKQYLAMLE